MFYNVLDSFGRVIFFGTLKQCYNEYPTLACVPIGENTGRGLSLLIEYKVSA